MRSLLHILTNGYLVLSVLAGLPAVATRSVLCVAPDGHVAIESGVGCCAERPAPARGDVQGDTRTADSGDCGDCVDIPVGAPVLHQTQGRLAASGTLGATVLLSPLMSVMSAATAALRSLRAPDEASHSVFAPSRTTVLRN